MTFTFNQQFKASQKSQRRINLLRDPIFVFPADLNFQEIGLFLSKSFSEFIERWILFKRSIFGYWNNASANLILIRCLILSAVITSLLYYAFKDNLAAHNKKIQSELLPLLTTYGSIFATLYLPDRTSYHQKWNYLAGLYNDYIKCEGHWRKQSIKAALSQDIAAMEMWSNNSFHDVFKTSLKAAVTYHNLILNGKSKLNDLPNKVELFCLSRNQAIDLLMQYQDAIKKKKLGDRNNKPKKFKSLNTKLNAA